MEEYIYVVRSSLDRKIACAYKTKDKAEKESRMIKCPTEVKKIRLCS